MTNSIPKSNIHQITFLGSFPRVSITPPSSLPEFAFIGRSNVGKSSLINFLCGRKKLAKISSTPGKTQMINLFEINEEWILADLPGYGYARTSKKTRAKWTVMIENYLLERPNLATVFLLIDGRIPPQDSDLSQLEWLAKNGIPFCIVFTKADKVKEDQLKKNMDTFFAELNKIFETLPNYFVTSSSKKIGREDLLDYIRFVQEQ